MLTGNDAELPESIWRAQLTWKKYIFGVLALYCVTLQSACSEPIDQPVPVETQSMSKSLIGTSWRVEDIDQGGIIDISLVTIHFPEEGQITGRTGCNNYFGAVVITGEAVAVSNVGVSRMACPEALMNQERQFTGALHDATRLEMDSDTWLVVYDENGVERLRAIAYEDPSVSPSSADLLPQDYPVATSHNFVCPGMGIAAFRFLGPDTIELKFDGKTYQLPHSRSASGAKYTADNVTFWNKGNEAVIEIGSRKVSCARQAN